ncbi:MAG: cryptochrome/photolyase family protein [Armatimonadaceae bacterium]
MRVCLVLGDQLNRAFLDVLNVEPPETVLMVESTALAQRMPYHARKLTLVWSAMRNYAAELREAGYRVEYVETDEPFADAIESAFRRLGGERIVLVKPREAGTRRLLCEKCDEAAIPYEMAEDPFWYVSPDEFRKWLEKHPNPKMETYYRDVRRHTRILMEGKNPAGGTWNLDHDNRKPFPKKHTPPKHFPVEPDEITRKVMGKVASLSDLYGKADGFDLPVTRSEALDALDFFVENLLPDFGAYEDAMSATDALGYHSVLSPAINLSLLSPQECVEAAVIAWERGHAPLNSVEGFVRQILGWREFMYHMFEEFDGDYHATNFLNHTRPLPSWYWTGETEMNCLRTVIRRVLETGYSHHIERLMVLSNFALMYGAKPHELNRWFWCLYVDAYEWVVTPNVVGMGQFADGGWVATKPYISSGAYINRMSDYCTGCGYNPKEASGEDACPFTTLYWSFLMEHEEEPLSARMGKNYLGMRSKSAEERAKIQERKQVLLSVLQ